MRAMRELREMACDELDNIVKGGSLNASTLDAADKLTHMIKSIDTVMAMEESGYSYAPDVRYRDRARRDYRDDGTSYRRRDYSRADGKSEMIDHLHQMMREATTEKERQIIQHCMDQLDD